ncbi:50S ribosomal protein L31 type B [Flavobacteriales bacterium ALC-1]|nr:50S ribosomal protein L31 type B [Flavobacteriales bacterium ALC-1]
MKQLYILVFLFITSFTFAQLAPPAELQAYYSGVDFTKTGTDLYDDLAVKTIAKHTLFLTYGERHQFLYDADEDPFNASNVRLIYSGESRSKTEYLSGSNPNSPQTFNTEHVYPRSLLGNGTAEADLHLLRTCDISVNSLRGNDPFSDGSGTPNQAYFSTGSSFFPGWDWRGDVARIIMYVNLRYNEPFTDVGTLNLFLEWNAADPVSPQEIEDNRNTVISGVQGNRNPFIDNPFLATVIWGGTQAENRWGENPPDDTEAPTIPTNLTASNETSSTVDLNWTGSTDNIGVTAYNIFVDNVFYVSTNSSATSIIVTGLSPETTYEFAVLARDLANNTSELSTSVNATTLEASSGGGSCVFETFENIPDNSSSYSDRMWTGDDNSPSQWQATRARTDQSINSRAITIDVRNTSDGSITSPLISNGIGSLTASTQRAFSGGSGTLDVLVNEVLVGTIPYGTDVQTTTISDINFNGNVQILISKNTSSGDRVIIDDLSWTCFPALSLSDEVLKQVKIYPNPTKNLININLTQNIETTVEIYDVLGKKVLFRKINKSTSLNTSSFKSGLYLMKFIQKDNISTKKLIIQ